MKAISFAAAAACVALGAACGGGPAAPGEPAAPSTAAAPAPAATSTAAPSTEPEGCWDAGYLIAEGWDGNDAHQAELAAGWLRDNTDVDPCGYAPGQAAEMLEKQRTERDRLRAEDRGADDSDSAKVNISAALAPAVAPPEPEEPVAEAEPAAEAPPTTAARTDVDPAQIQDIGQASPASGSLPPPAGDPIALPASEMGQMPSDPAPPAEIGCGEPGIPWCSEPLDVVVGARITWQLDAGYMDSFPAGVVPPPDERTAADTTVTRVITAIRPQDSEIAGRQIVYVDYCEIGPAWESQFDSDHGYASYGPNGGRSYFDKWLREQDGRLRQIGSGGGTGAC